MGPSGSAWGDDFPKLVTPLVKIVAIIRIIEGFDHTPIGSHALVIWITAHKM